MRSENDVVVIPSRTRTPLEFCPTSEANKPFLLTTPQPPLFFVPVFCVV